MKKIFGMAALAFFLGIAGATANPLASAGRPPGSAGVAVAV